MHQFWPRSISEMGNDALAFFDEITKPFSEVVAFAEGRACSVRGPLRHRIQQIIEQRSDAYFDIVLSKRHARTSGV